LITLNSLVAEFSSSVFNEISNGCEYKELKSFFEKTGIKEAVYDMVITVQCYIHDWVAKRLKVSEIKNSLK
jgi:predicted nucleic acid-binding protein